MDHYGKARREGLRIYSAAIQAHEDPYLPVLEETEPALARLNRNALGVQTVPLERVAGSVSRGRSYAFTRGFYPILESGSEFAGKWERLYASVEENGINQPVTLLEYMGTYYVTEGNKRVSVMKCMGAVDIEGDVTRVIPPQTDDAEHQAYSEYCDFTRETGIFQIFFTKLGSYQKLCTLPGVRAGESWTEDEILALKRVYSTFRSAYLSLRETDSTEVGDAFLALRLRPGHAGGAVPDARGGRDVSADAADRRGGDPLVADHETVGPAEEKPGFPAAERRERGTDDHLRPDRTDHRYRAGQADPH